MNKLTVNAKSGSYPVFVGPNELAEAPNRFREVGVQAESTIAIITDTNLFERGYAQTLSEALNRDGFRTVICTIKPGDESKSLTSAEALYNQLLDAGVRRNGVVVALGGGVVGDLAGFVAATYQRGIRFIQMPTTLLAHDSSLGGKVGVNLPRGKNLVGAFHAPTAVLYDITTLKTLPEREWRNGMAEVIKHGLIGQLDLLKKLAECPCLHCPEVDEAVQLLSNAMRVKIDVVQQDEFESGLRMVLNLGHTVGHAVEQLSHYTIGHGEAVSIGTCVEARIAMQRELLTEDQFQFIKSIFRAHGLPVRPPEYPIDDILSLIEVDKKHKAKGWMMAVPEGLGHVTMLHDVTAEEVRQAWFEELK